MNENPSFIKINNLFHIAHVFLSTHLARKCIVYITMKTDYYYVPFSAVIHPLTTIIG